MTLQSTAKRWWHSLTIWFGNACVAGGYALNELSKNSDDIRNALGHYGASVVSAIGVAVILLRLKTKAAVAGTPAAKSQDAP